MGCKIEMAHRVAYIPWLWFAPHPQGWRLPEPLRRGKALFYKFPLPQIHTHNIRIWSISFHDKKACKKSSFSFSKYSSPKIAHHFNLSSSLYLTTVDQSRDDQIIVLTVLDKFSFLIFNWGQIRLMGNFWANEFRMGNFNCYCL